MASMLFTLPNAADLGTLTAGSTAAGSNVTNLQSPEITSVWRSAPDVLPGSGQTLAAGGGAGPLVYPASRWLQYKPAAALSYDHAIAVAALINDSARPYAGSGVTRKWRARIYASAGNQLSGIVRPAPSGPTLTNLTGATSPGGVWQPATSWLTATSPTANTVAVMSFSSAATDGGALPLKAGAGLQTFSILCRRSGSGGTNPTLSIDLYESGLLVANLASGIALVGTTPVVVSVQWNASLLASLSSTTAGLRVTGTAGSSQTVEFAAFEWLAEHNGYLYDSGDQAVSYPVTVAQQAARVFNLPVALPTPIPSGSPYVLVDQMSTADAYAQQGRMVVANAIQPFVNMDYNWGISWADMSPVSETPGGQEWFEVRPKRRIGELVCNALRTAEAWDQIFSQLQGSVGISGNFLWMPDPATPSEFYNNVIWGRFDGLSPVKNPRFARYSQSYKIKEVL